MGDKMNPDLVDPRLESFYPPFVAGIDLPHRGIVDSYNLNCFLSLTIKWSSNLCIIVFYFAAKPLGNLILWTEV